MSNRERRRVFFTVVSITAIIIFCGGVYFYYYFFRQMNAKLIETIPTDAAFLFQINDNETFLKTVKNIHPYISPLFGLDAYPGCQFFVDQLPGKYNQVVFTGHANGAFFSILFACKINKQAFKPLLAKLQIDEKNCIKFEQCKIYTYGTHFKRFVFTYHQGIFLASENVALLKKAIMQLRNPRNLTTHKSFVELFNIIEKNRKQNWIILNQERYFSNFQDYFNDETNLALSQFSSNATWAAYQARFSGLDMLLTGYLAINGSFQNYFKQIEPKYAYYSSLSKTDEPVDFEKNIFLKQAKAFLPTHNDYEIAIHVANTAYWERYLSELGMKKFTLTQMKLFAFAFDSLNTKFNTANAFIKF